MIGMTLPPWAAADTKPSSEMPRTVPPTEKISRPNTAGLPAAQPAAGGGAGLDASAAAGLGCSSVIGIPSVVSCPVLAFAAATMSARIRPASLRILLTGNGDCEAPGGIPGATEAFRTWCLAIRAGKRHVYALRTELLIANDRIV